MCTLYNIHISKGVTIRGILINPAQQKFIDSYQW